MNSEINFRNEYRIQAIDFPILALENIFMYIPGHYLCNIQILVSKKWKQIIDTNSFWIKKCCKEKKLNKKLHGILDEYLVEWKAKDLYFRKLYITKNLLKNNNGEAIFEHWWINTELSEYFFPKHLSNGLSLNIKDLIENYYRFQDENFDLDQNEKWSISMNESNYFYGRIQFFASIRGRWGFCNRSIFYVFRP